MSTHIEYEAIGIIHTPFRDLAGMPIQPSGGKGVRGTVEVFPAYRAGLKDLEGFSHVILLYHLHRSVGFDLEVVPFLDSTPHGVFATRAPRRPNPIGLSIVTLCGIAEGVVEIEDVDILDGTPLLDLKPHVPEFDGQTEVRTGWLSDRSAMARGTKSDRRFE